jgi:hypothetical protein
MRKPPIVVSGPLFIFGTVKDALHWGQFISRPVACRSTSSLTAHDGHEKVMNIFASANQSGEDS